jgi:hypothetical protein
MKRIIGILFFCLLLFHCSKKKTQEELIPKENLEQAKEPTLTLSSDSIITVSLKGAELSKIYQGDTTLFTTVADVDGVISIDMLKDKRVYKIAFMSNKVLSELEIASFKKSIENNYNINLEENTVYKNHFYKYSDNIYYSYIENQIEKNSYSISFSITDKNLQQLKDIKPSSDF